MEPQQPSRRLSCISTSWSAVFQANHGHGPAPTSAQRLVLLRYYQPIYRYLRAMVRDEDAAEELTHEFAVRFLRGDFKRADPSRGRFRDLVKRALRHLAIDHWRRRRLEDERVPLAEDWQVTPAEADWRRGAPPRRGGAASGQGTAEGDWHHRPPPRRRPAAPDLDSAEADRTFLEGWRGEILDQAWEELARFQEQTGHPYHTVLRLRTEYPEERSAGLTRLAGDRLGRPLSEASFRQLVHRSREKFADFLVAAVARTLAATDADAVEQELIELELLPCCRRAVARLRRSNS
jgi:RNA polymerase sigma-70 factor (ECF subfamily)